MVWCWSFVVIQSLSCVCLFATPWTAACQPSLSFTIYWSLLKLMSIESVMPSNHVTLCHHLLLHSTFPESGYFPKSWHFASGGQCIGVSASASVFQWKFSIDFLWNWLVWSPCSPRDSQESSPAPQFWKHQFFGNQPFLWSNSYIHKWLLEKPYLWLYRPLLAKWCLCVLICCLDLYFSQKPWF